MWSKSLKVCVDMWHVVNKRECSARCSAMSEFRRVGNQLSVPFVRDTGIAVNLNEASSFAKALPFPLPNSQFNIKQNATTVIILTWTISLANVSDS